MKCIFRSMKLLFVMVPALLLYTGSISAQHYTQTNLVSDVVGLAPAHDPNLVNPWGITRSATSPWWVSDNNSGDSTLYTGTGQIIAINGNGIVTIPHPKNAPAGALAARASSCLRPMANLRRLSLLLRMAPSPDGTEGRPHFWPSTITITARPTVRSTRAQRQQSGMGSGSCT
jgi:hypothetical protein